MTTELAEIDQRKLRGKALTYASHLADDLTQEGLIAAWGALQEGHSVPLAAWRADQRMRRLLTPERREKWTGHDHEGSPSIAARSVPLEYAPERYESMPEIHTDVVQAVRSLPPRERWYVFYRFWEDRTNEDAAARAGVGKNAWGKSIRHSLAERLTPA